MTKRIQFYFELAVRMSNENWTWDKIHRWLLSSDLTNEEILLIKAELNKETKLS